MLVLEPRRLGNDLRRSTLRFADQVADRGHELADKGRAAFHRVTSSRPDPLDEVRAIAAFTVGAVTLIGVGYWISRIVRSRHAKANHRNRQPRHAGDRGDRNSGGEAPGKREEATHELLARLDSPEAIQRHNELMRQLHENAKASDGRASKVRPDFSKH